MYVCMYVCMSPVSGGHQRFHAGLSVPENVKCPQLKKVNEFNLFRSR